MKKNMILAGMFILAVTFTLTSNSSKPTQIPVIQEVKTTDFTEEKLIEYVKELNIKFPHIVLAQARLESGNFKSNIFKENNNLFGMKEAKQRISTNKGTNLGHAKYESWKECVLDYALYQATYLSKFKTEEQYYSYLADNYAANGRYVKLLRDIAKEYK
jgi:uncharacterized FlgJ-related protein